MSEVSAACGAATGCGGCRPLVSKIVQQELDSQNRHRLPTLQAIMLVGS